MTLIVFTIPDAPGELPAWLEQKLVSLDLPRLVAELDAVHAPAPHTTLRDLLGAHLAAIAHSGLGGAPPEAVRQLLLQPRLLLELHEHIVLEGGAYWDRHFIGAVLPEEHLERGRRHVEGLAGGRRGPALESWERRAWLGAVLALAAGVMLLVGVWGPWRSAAPQGWGWGRPGALAVNRPAPEYLSGLADSAEEWFSQRPADHQGLARRLNEFRAGCTTLILAEHPRLSPKDRDWLRERCRAWAKKLDTHLADLEGGTKSVEAVLAEADATVNQLIIALRTRAGQV